MRADQRDNTAHTSDVRHSRAWGSGTRSSTVRSLATLADQCEQRRVTRWWHDVVQSESRRTPL